jgi:hypothetical protein
MNGNQQDNNIMVLRDLTIYVNNKELTRVNSVFFSNRRLGLPKHVNYVYGEQKEIYHVIFPLL